MRKKKKADALVDTSEIQESGNILLDNKLEQIRKKFSDLKIIKTSEEHQKDRGIDFQIELVNKSNEATIDLFKLQVKATTGPLVPLKTTINKGLFSFQLSNRHVFYYQNEIPVALLFLLCDLSTEQIYWHAIQLDDSLEDRVNESLINAHDSIQIFINPDKILEPDNFLAFVDDAEQSKNTQFFRASDERMNPLTATKDFDVDIQRPLLDQLFDVMEYLYAEVRYLPIHLLTQHYPFKTSTTFTPYYHWFKLYTDNAQLVEMLASFEVTIDNKINFLNDSYIKDVDDYEEKAIAILQKFTQNHIYYVSAQKNGKEATTRLFSNENCDCVACLYHRLDIPGSIKVLKKHDQGGKVQLDERMKNAYMHYRLGNYLGSAKAFQGVAKEARKANKKTLFLITQFNLLKLGRLIKNSYFDHDTQVFAKKLLQINLERAVYAAHNKSHHRRLFNWIKEVKFYSENAFEIQSSVSQLRNDYQTYLRGNVGNTRNYDGMLNGFAQLNSFINNNCIVYDRYSEYKLQVEEFTEGVFIAFALHNNTLTELIDYHIHRFIFDGDHKVTWRYFNKYNLKSIPYKKSDDDDHFMVLIKNLLTNNQLMKEAFRTYSPEEGSYWRNGYPAIFCNCLCLASILALSDSDVESITRALMSCYAAGDLPSPDAYGQVDNFLSFKMKQISSSLIKEAIYFFLSFNDQSLQQRFEVLTTELKIRKEHIILSADQQAKLFVYSFADPDRRNFNTAIYFYAISDKTLKGKIEAKITASMQDKFDAYLYYYAAISDVIPFLDSEFIEKFVDATYPDPNKYSFRQGFYGPEDNTYPMLDMLFNICFKFDLLPTQISERNFLGFGDYYDWLLDIDGFNYSKFKISWLLLYPTKFYLKNFREHDFIRMKLEEYLGTTRDVRFERLYFDLYAKIL